MRRVLPRDEAVAYFKGLGEHYKAEIIASIPADEDVSLYREGGFEDLCRGPHVPSTGKLQPLQADEGGRRLLARRPGATSSCSASTARPGPRKDELQQLPAHARGGREARPPQARPRTRPVPPRRAFARARCSGTPRAGRSGSRSSSTCARVYRDNGYQEVKGPQILDQGLWEKTGHWDKYRENMFTTESEKRDYALKPMNCPGHILIFKQGIKSYRDLPLRYGEFGQCHRNEPTGGLHGIMRVRGFTQDDGHIFCTEDLILDECVAYTALLQKVYADFGFTRHHLQGGHAAREAHRHRRDLGQGRARADREPAALGLRVRDLAGRGRLLRPEDRIHAEGRHRPPVAVRHDAGRLLHARAAGRRVRGRDRASAGTR